MPLRRYADELHVQVRQAGVNRRFLHLDRTCRPPEPHPHRTRTVPAPPLDRAWIRIRHCRYRPCAPVGADGADNGQKKARQVAG
ncbi:hypothetical protein SAMN06295900_109151 [Trinickia caryophylli]|uniref:Uncharacterized protein n=1 Tax=Trinickia caryophylli TaxID=28094 RepID=A0A1X7FLQ4_TRICW|nr:hypothetical protein SAMN06295900_109151 [Trinickia caryophylli]